MKKKSVCPDLQVQNHESSNLTKWHEPEVADPENTKADGLGFSYHHYPDSQMKVTSYYFFHDPSIITSKHSRTLI